MFLPHGLALLEGRRRETSQEATAGVRAKDHGGLHEGGVWRYEKQWSLDCFNINPTRFAAGCVPGITNPKTGQLQTIRII